MPRTRRPRDASAPFDEPIPSDHQISRLFVATSKRDYGSDGVAKVGHTVIPPTGQASCVCSQCSTPLRRRGVAVRPTRRRSPSELRELGGGLQPRDVRGVRVAMEFVEVGEVQSHDGGQAANQRVAAEGLLLAARHVARAADAPDELVKELLVRIGRPRLSHDWRVAAGLLPDAKTPRFLRIETLGCEGRGAARLRGLRAGARSRTPLTTCRHPPGPR